MRQSSSASTQAHGASRSASSGATVLLPTPGGPPRRSRCCTGGEDNRSVARQQSGYNPRSMDLVAQLLVGVVTFASTNVDDLFVLALLFADSELRPRSIVAGQLAGIGALVAASALAGLAAVAIPARWTALLGALPLALGVREMRVRRRSQRADADLDDAGGPPRSVARSQLLAVAAVTIANGGDNLAVYVPLFVSEIGRAHV